MSNVASRIAASIEAEAGPVITDAEPAGDSPSTTAAAPPAAVDEPKSPVGSAPEMAAEQRAELALRDLERERVAEKLAEARERRAAAAMGKRARQQLEQANEAARAAQAEKSKWEALQRGTFKEGMAALGRDPRKVFEEMQREAIEANTPEAEMRRIRADFERQMGETVEPLKKTIDQLLREREDYATQAHESSLQSAYQATITDNAYLELRTEYDDADLLAYVRDFDQNPQKLFQAARTYGVRLTNPAKGFTMREILEVLKSAQDAHNAGRQQRAARLKPPVAAEPDSKATTVNGTAPRRNAETTIGNDLAAERASPARKLSRKERIQAEIERIERR